MLIEDKYNILHVSICIHILIKNCDQNKLYE